MSSLQRTRTQIRTAGAIAGLAIGCVALIPIAASAQTLPNASPLVAPVFQAMQSNGKPYSGAKLCTYQAGTTTPQATYTDSTAGTPNANPVVLNALGQAPVYVGTSLYKFVLRNGGDATCSTGTVVWSEDNVGDTTLYFVNFVKTAGTATLITYTPAQSGGASQTVNAKLNSYLSVLDFGAKCDNSTDDTTAVQNAIAAALATNLALHIDGTAACIVQPLTTGAGLYMVGPGTLKAKGTFSAAQAMITISANNITLDNLTLDGNSASQSNRINLVADTGGHSNVVLRKVHFTDTGGNGVQTGTSAIANWMVVDSVFDTISTAHAGGGAALSFVASCNSCIISRNQFNGSSDIQAGVGFGESANTNSRVVIADNIFHGMVLVPIELASACTGCVILGNNIDGSGTNGISTGSLTDGAISGNTVASQSNYCIELENGVRVAITGNSCYNNPIGVQSFGGTSSGSTDITVTGNIFHTMPVGSGQGFGIVADSWVRAVISSNEFYDCMTICVKMTFNAGLGGAGGSDINVENNSFIFHSARVNAPIAILFDTYSQATAKNNDIRIDDAGGAAGATLGVINVNNTCNRLRVTSNHIYSSVMAGADTTGIRLTSGAVVTDGLITGNFIDGFNTGIYDATGTTTASLTVTPNTILNTTTNYSVNSTDIYNALGDGTYGGIEYDCPAARCTVNVPLWFEPLAAQSGRVMQWMRRDSTVSGAVTWQVGGGLTANASNVLANISNAQFEVNSGSVIAFATWPFTDCAGGTGAGNLLGGIMLGNGTSLATANRIMLGTGKPGVDFTLFGLKGDLFLNQNGGGSTTLYVKESGASCASTGWVAK